jgi:hypothetical protein
MYAISLFSRLSLEHESTQNKVATQRRRKNDDTTTTGEIATQEVTVARTAADVKNCERPDAQPPDQPEAETIITVEASKEEENAAVETVTSPKPMENFKIPIAASRSSGLCCHLLPQQWLHKAVRWSFTMAPPTRPSPSTMTTPPTTFPLEIRTSRWNWCPKCKPCVHMCNRCRQQQIWPHTRRQWSRELEQTRTVVQKAANTTVAAANQGETTLVVDASEIQCSF